MTAGPKPNSNLSSIESSMYWRARHIVFKCAIKYGLSNDDAEDYASEFLMHTRWRQGLASFKQADDTHDKFDAWLWRCAENWIRDALRKRARSRAHEIPLSEIIEREANSVHIAGISTGEPVSSLFREEYQKRINEAVNQLTPTQRFLFSRYYLHNDSIQEIANSTGRTVHALEQSLYALRKRLRNLLDKRGFTTVEAQDYILYITCND